MIESERRKIERFPLKLSTYLSLINGKINSKSIQLVTSNICSNGAFFKTEKPFSVKTKVKLDIIFPLDKFNNSKGKVSYVEVKGFVIRTDKGGMAICFDKGYKIAPNLYD